MRRRRSIGDTAWHAGLRLAVAALLAALLACGDGNGDRVDEPGAAALRLFEVARVDEPTDEQLRATFVSVPREDARAVLLDALAALARPEELVIVDILRPAGAEDDAFVDLAAPLPGGGVAHFNVRLRTAEPGSWRVSWFGGPGVEWPPSPARRGDGLTSSAPPGTAR
jgi:hypothetical protein